MYHVGFMWLVRSGRANGKIDLLYLLWGTSAQSKISYACWLFLQQFGSILFCVTGSREYFCDLLLRDCYH